MEQVRRTMRSQAETLAFPKLQAERECYGNRKYAES